MEKASYSSYVEDLVGPRGIQWSPAAKLPRGLSGAEWSKDELLL